MDIHGVYVWIFAHGPFDWGEKEIGESRTFLAFEILSVRIFLITFTKTCVLWHSVLWHRLAFSNLPPKRRKRNWWNDESVIIAQEARSKYLLFGCRSAKQRETRSPLRVRFKNSSINRWKDDIFVRFSIRRSIFCSLERKMNQSRVDFRMPSLEVLYASAKVLYLPFVGYVVGAR